MPCLCMNALHVWRRCHHNNNNHHRMKTNSIEKKQIIFTVGNLLKQDKRIAH